MPEHEVKVRLHCRVRLCGTFFEVLDNVFDFDDWKKRLRCPACDSDSTALADVQPRPRMWWSEKYGLLTEHARHSGAEHRRITWNEFGLGPRSMPQLPLDAVPLIPQPLARDQAERRALDEFSMIWENSRMTKGVLAKALNHVVGVLLFSDPEAPLPEAWKDTKGTSE